VVVFTIDANLRDAGAGSPGILGALSLDTVDNQGQARSWRTLMAGASIARAAAADALVFARDGDLNAVGFDAARLGIAGAPRAIAGNVATARGRAQYALSPSGALVVAQDTSGGDQQAVTLERGGSAGPMWPYRDAALSPDGTRIAGVKIEETRSDIWIADVERGGATRLTHTAANTSPVWSADGRSIYFASRANGPFEIWRRDAGGTSAAVRVHQAGRHAFPLAASPDGALLAFLQTDERTRADIWVLPLADGQPRPLVQGPFDEGAAQFSPDSSMIAFESAESGRWEIYVSRVRDGKRTLVSTSGGRHPIWTSAGLHYQTGRKIVRATVTDDNGELRVRAAADAASIDGDLIGLAADGRVLTSRAASRSTTATVALDWLRELRALLGPLVSEPPR
jgi:Tol biopolymer transport system component